MQIDSTLGEAAQWLRHHPVDGAPQARLVCLPHAGGTAGFFRSLGPQVAPGIEVVSVQYPGRQDRVRDQAVSDIRSYARHVTHAIASLDDLPFALFGHSMGAIIAYEILARFGALLPAPRALFVSAHLPPTRHRPIERPVEDDEAIIAHAIELGGPGSHLLADPALAEILLPPIRNDLRAVATHRHKRADPLDCPIVALIGRDDPTTPNDAIRDWGNLTHGDFSVASFPGSHFYVERNMKAVAALVYRNMLGTG